MAVRAIKRVLSFVLLPELGTIIKTRRLSSWQSPQPLRSGSYITISERPIKSLSIVSRSICRCRSEFLLISRESRQKKTQVRKKVRKNKGKPREPRSNPCTFGSGCRRAAADPAVARQVVEYIVFRAENRQR